MQKGVLVGFGLTLLAFVNLVVGCGGGSSGGGSSESSREYSGPGSDYKLVLSSGGGFALTESDDNMSLTGTWSDLDSGFKKLTVVTTNKSGVPVGSGAYVLEIPGVVTLLKPLDGDQVINMIVSGACPSANFSANWINSNTNVDHAHDDIIGTFSYTHSTTSAILPNAYDINGSSGATNENIGTFSCTDGIANVTGAKMYLTQVGGAIVRSYGGDNQPGGGDDNFIVALPQNSIGSASNLNGNYVGLVYDESASSNNVFPIKATFSDGNGTVNAITDVDNNTVDPNNGVTVTLANIDSPSNGFLSATVEIDGDSGSARCIADINTSDSDKNFIYCTGEVPSDAAKLYSMFFISK
jgi:hypothetical protein